MPSTRGIGVALLLLFASGDIDAQEAPRTQAGGCYRGRPLPTCTWFVITEVGYYRQVIGRKVEIPSDSSGVQAHRIAAMPDDVFAWEIGGMSNVGTHNAVGATFMFAGGLGELGVRGRYRRWLSPTGTALDFGAGISKIMSSEGTASFTSNVDLNAADRAAVSIRLSVANTRHGKATSLYGGVRLGSHQAIWGTVGMAVFLTLYLASQTQGN